ncbi:hypothetical protein [Gallaecimonas sp. GXIMD4217]|uniref:hypothetical protein n=1 Tax=Gallaecimonas sp. GXIMD4217 TaxID=3131927 RepID=UPI00311AD6BB
MANYLDELGLVSYTPKNQVQEPGLVLSYPLTDDTRSFCEAVAEALSLPLRTNGPGVQWGPEGDIQLDPAHCIGNAANKRLLWQALVPFYDQYRH